MEDLLSTGVTAVLKVIGLVMVGTTVLMAKHMLTNWIIPLMAGLASAGSIGQDNGFMGGLMIGAVSFAGTAWILRRFTRIGLRSLMRASDWIELRLSHAVAVIMQMVVIGIPAAIAAHGIFIVVFDNLLGPLFGGVSEVNNWIASGLLGFVFWNMFREYAEGHSPFEPDIDIPDFQ